MSVSENNYVPELSPHLLIKAYRYVLEFIVNNPSPAEIASFQPTPEMQARLKQLIARERTNAITAAEKAELDEYMHIEHLVVMLKAGNLRFVSEAH
jgi:hypothetical protein